MFVLQTRNAREMKERFMGTDAEKSFSAAGVVARDWGWRHASRKDFALRHVDFTIQPGERVLLLGARYISQHDAGDQLPVNGHVGGHFVRL